MTFAAKVVMENDTVSYIVWGVLLAAIAVWIYYVYRRRWLIRKRFQIDELFKNYFQNGIAAGELGRRVRAVVSRGFIGGDEFYALATAAFQRAVNAARTHAAHSELERTLLT